MVRRSPNPPGLGEVPFLPLESRGWPQKGGPPGHIPEGAWGSTGQAGGTWAPPVSSGGRVGVQRDTGAAAPGPQLLQMPTGVERGGLTQPADWVQKLDLVLCECAGAPWRRPQPGSLPDPEPNA